MRTFFFVLILSVAGMVWAFPTHTDSTFVEGKHQLVQSAVKPVVQVEVQPVVTKSEPQDEGPTYSEQLAARLEHLRKLNAPPPVPDTVITIENNVTALGLGR
jgi:hypothetical protein